jgi:hypothetical protein
MRDRLVVGGSFQRPVNCLDPPFDGGFAEPRLGEMMGDDLWLAFSHCLKPIAQGLGNAPMQYLPAALEQVLVGRVLHQRVLEGIDGFRRITTSEHEFRVLEPASASFNAVSSRPTNARNSG